ncbi:hypothetical protein [Plasmodium yoelii yoelii]|uniref:Uncharacterized protein n=1 Tax=Plasmodium yoelii yoelii TaxID=73239 RepID=Q7R9M4_PLAYO|nr:hypothetical protein [Plasmodium yoelii yoelii]
MSRRCDVYHRSVLFAKKKLKQNKLDPNYCTTTTTTTTTYSY